MPLYLDVPVFAQNTPNDCWWACMRMIFAYYGQYRLTPSEVNGQFDLSWSPYAAHLSRSPFPPSLDVLESTPSLWTTFGVPPVDGAMGLLSRLTGFQRITERPADWDGDSLEQLLRGHGPLMFYGRRHGAFHAFVLTGADGVQACMNDPDGGQPFRESIENFNRHMVDVGVVPGPHGAAVSFHEYNPLYLPDERPVRETTSSPAGPVR